MTTRPAREQSRAAGVTAGDGRTSGVNAHVLPAWRTWRLRNIERLVVQSWLSDRFRKGVGWQVVRNSWTLLSSILESAVEHGSLDSNPARGVKFPQQGMKQKPAMIAGDDFVRLLRLLSEPHRTMVSLIAATGLRVGELLALRWGALNLGVGTLAVRESVFEGTFQTPKTQRALRTIPLGPRIVKLLVEHGGGSVGRRPSDLAFGNRRGEPLRESKVLTQGAATRSGRGGTGAGDVASVPAHPLFAHVDLKVPMKIAQEQLGHASIATTLNIYTHVVDASHRSAVEAVEGRLFVESVSNCLESARPLDTATPQVAALARFRFGGAARI